MRNFDCDTFCERAADLFGDMGQVELSQKIGIAQGVISAIKNKKVKAPGADTVCALAKYFNVSADWLLGLSNVKTTDKATKEMCAALGLSDAALNALMDGIDSKEISRTIEMLLEEYAKSGMGIYDDFNEEQPILLPLTRFFQILEVKKDVFLANSIDGFSILTDEDTVTDYATPVKSDLPFDDIVSLKHFILSCQEREISLYLMRQRANCTNEAREKITQKEVKRITLIEAKEDGNN